VNLADEFEQLGALLIREVAGKTNDVAGDGTTTATVLAQAIVREGLKFVETGANPILLKKGLEKYLSLVLKELEATAKKLETTEEIAQIASISANDKEIGQIIAEAIEAVGRDGMITVAESQTFGIEKEVIEGMQIQSGYISPYMVTDMAKMESRFELPHILFYEGRVVSMESLMPLINQLIEAKHRELVIVAQGVDGEALVNLIHNHTQGKFFSVAVQAPYFKERRRAVLEDMAIFTGGTLISDKLGMRLEDVKLEHLGKADKVIVSKDKTMVIGGHGDEKAIADRVELLTKEIEECDNEFDKEKLAERKGRITAGVAVIKVGAATDTELTEVSHRVEDALNATRAAIEEGIVMGGGMALFGALPKIKESTPEGEEEQFAQSIMMTALASPLRQIVGNAGKDIGEVIGELKKHDKTIGYNAATDTYENLIENGIIDPVKVTRTALENAVSIASLVLTTEAVVLQPEKKESKE